MAGLSSFPKLEVGIKALSYFAVIIRAFLQETAALSNWRAWKTVSENEENAFMAKRRAKRIIVLSVSRPSCGTNNWEKQPAWKQEVQT